MTNTLSYNDWLTLNQQYLSLSLQVVLQQLKQYEAGIHHSNEVVIDDSLTDQLTQLRQSMKRLPAIEQLVQLFGLSSFEKNILLTCVGVELDAAFQAIIKRIQGHQQNSFALCLAAFTDTHWSAIAPESPLRYWRLIETGNNSFSTHSPISIDEAMLHYITGVGQLDEKLGGMVQRYTTTDQPSEAMIERLTTLLTNKWKSGSRLPVLVLTGNDTTDRRMAAVAASQITRLPLFILSANSIPTSNSDGLELARRWNREALIRGGLLLIETGTVDIQDKQRLNAIQQFVSLAEMPMLISSDGWVPVIERGAVMIDIPVPTAEEQTREWKQRLGTFLEGTNGMLDRVVSQFSLPTSSIRKAAADIEGQTMADQPFDMNEKETMLWKAVSQHARPQLEDLAQRIEPAARWEDLVLPEQQKNILKEIIVHVKNRNTVYNKWGFASKGQRGLGISAMFAGESGTGKTMASEVLANELQLDVYKIDLSKVVSKYIGETEKNLKKIFDAAEQGGAILLFDEADALFGKRSDVKDSHDRYSNIEVSYLLQRMEAYRGLAILTTNMKSALDKAFLRRIRFVVQFPFPDATQRAEIWNKVFPVKTPKENLDIEKLSRLTVAGGNIRNIAMNAAFLAAEDKSSVQMDHILRAAKTEYAKMEIPFNGDLRSLS